MKILYGLIYEMDSSMKFMYIFLPCAIILLTILYHFMKKHTKIWSALCAIPLIVYIIFLSKEYYVGNVNLTINRYAAFGVVCLFIALWGLVVLLKCKFKICTIIVMILSAVVLLINIISIWAVWLRPNVANFSHLGWTESFIKTIDYLEQEYILNDWKEIDYNKIRNELIPKVKAAEQAGDETGFVAALYELKYEMSDGHVAVRGDIPGRDAAITRLAGNDYGLSMFRTKNGEIIAILVDENSECYKKGIHNGTVITKWNNVPVDEAAADVKCIDRIYEFQTWENIHIGQPIFLAGEGGDQVSVTFINDEGIEETIQLSSIGKYINRRTKALAILFGDNVISSNNYSMSMIDKNIGYLRITEEEYSQDPLFITKSTIKGFSQEIYDDLDGRLEKLREEGMDRIIIDIRNNEGGNGFESRTVASMFTSNSVPYYLTLYKDGEYKVMSKAKDIHVSKWDELPVVVLVNGQTASAGEEIANYLKGSKNVRIVGNTTTWGAVQGTGGSTILSGGKYELRFPITPTVGDDHLPVVDVKADRHARLTLDYQIEYSKEEAVEFFSTPGEDRVLEKAIEYIQQLNI